MNTSLKRNLVCLLSSIAFTTAIQAQTQKTAVRLNAYGSYVFDDKVDSYYSNTSYFNGKIKGGFMWGGGLEFRLHDYYGLEVLYQRLDTHAPVNYYDNSGLNPGVKSANLDVAINYILVGGARSMHPNAKAEPYGGFLLGMAIIDSKNTEANTSSSTTKFAFGFRGGVNLWASERVGIKLQAQLLSVPQGVGGSLYFGTGGAGAGVSTYSTMLQFVLGGGLTFKLGNQGKQ